MASSVLAAPMDGFLPACGSQFYSVSMPVHFPFYSVSKGWAMKCVHCSESACDWVVLLSSDK